MKSKLFLLLLLTIHSTYSRCLEGCLRCSPDFDCLYCDIKNHYYLKNDRCFKSTQKNCLLMNERNQCLKCADNFYLDRFTNSCIELFTQIKVENCSYHSRPNYCEVCSKGFFMLKGACMEIASPISSCEVENSRAECERCDKNYIRSYDRKSCI